MEQHHGPDEIWKKFIGCFGVLGSFLRKWGFVGVVYGGLRLRCPFSHGMGLGYLGSTHR